MDNSDEEIELPNDILEALERQDEGSKPNIEELEIIIWPMKVKNQEKSRLGPAAPQSKRKRSSHC